MSGGYRNQRAAVEVGAPPWRRNNIADALWALSLPAVACPCGQWWAWKSEQPRQPLVCFGYRQQNTWQWALPGISPPLSLSPVAPQYEMQVSILGNLLKRLREGKAGRETTIKHRNSQRTAGKGKWNSSFEAHPQNKVLKDLKQMWL